MKKVEATLVFLAMSWGIGVAQAGEACPITHTPVKTEDQALDLAIQVTKAFKLTSVPVEHCLHFYVEPNTDKGGGYVVTVRENHVPECGGNPDTEPRLFDLEIRPDGQVASDARSADGSQMLTLRCPGTQR